MGTREPTLQLGHGGALHLELLKDLVERLVELVEKLLDASHLLGVVALQVDGRGTTAMRSVSSNGCMIPGSIPMPHHPPPCFPRRKQRRGKQIDRQTPQHQTRDGR